MNSNEEIQEVWEVVNEAVKLIKAEHSGANLDEARKFLLEAGDAVKADMFDDAVELAKNAQLAAKPTTEYLLSRAKELVTSAEKNFGLDGYEGAIDQWRKSLEEYGRASKLAEERNEPEIVEKIAEVEIGINENISKAELSIDNQKMFNLVEIGSSTVEEANRLFKDKKFDESRENYEKAKAAFEEAQTLAEKRGFAVDMEKIDEALGSIETSIEAVLLSKGDAMLKGAEESYKEKKFAESEKNFSSAIEFISELKIRREELEEMAERGREGLIMAKLEQGREKMQAADQLFEDVRYYDSKEGYKTSREYLEGVLEEASGYKLSELVDELTSLIQACSQNISAATAALMGVNVGAVEPKILTVDSVGIGGAEFHRTATETLKTRTYGGGTPSPEPTQSDDIEIKRGYEVLQNNDIRFGIRITNNTNYAILDVETLLDFNKTLFMLQSDRIMNLNNLHPGGERTVEYVLKPLGCIHSELIGATVIYRDHTGEKHTVQMRPREVHCVCPFLKEKAMREREFVELAEESNEHSEEGISFSGIGINEIAEIIKSSCIHRLYTVGEYEVDRKKILCLAGESIGEQAYYLLAAVIQPYKGATQVALRAYSDKPHGLRGFLNEIAGSVRYLVGSVQSAKEIEIIENKQVINIIDSVVQRTSFGGIGDGTGTTSVNIEGSVLQRSPIGSTRKCQSCGVGVQADAEFCTECGTKLG